MENHPAWNIGAAVEYYKNCRNRPEDIYESERQFFFPLIRNNNSILDVGCAAGGIYNIIRAVNPNMKYVGTDVSEDMIVAARTLFAEGDFRLAAGLPFDFPDDSFDVVLALGVLNHVPDYQTFIRECFRVARRYCLLDLPRLVPHEHAFSIDSSYMILHSRFHESGNESVATKVPYVIADAAEVLSFLQTEFAASRILAKGYFGACDPSVTMPFDKVCFTVACIDKNYGSSDMVVDLPGTVLKRLEEQGVCHTPVFERLLG